MKKYSGVNSYLMSISIPIILDPLVISNVSTSLEIFKSILLIFKSILLILIQSPNIIVSKQYLFLRLKHTTVIFLSFSLKVNFLVYS